MNNILVKQRKWFITAIFIAAIFSAVSAYAQTMENWPVCNFEGIIKSVESKDAISNNEPSVYLLGINIDSVSSGGGDEAGFYTCQSFYTLRRSAESFCCRQRHKSG